MPLSFHLYFTVPHRVARSPPVLLSLHFAYVFVSWIRIKCTCNACVIVCVRSCLSTRVPVHVCISSSRLCIVCFDTHIHMYSVVVLLLPPPPSPSSTGLKGKKLAHFDNSMNIQWFSICLSIVEYGSHIYFSNFCCVQIPTI